MGISVAQVAAVLNVIIILSRSLTPASRSSTLTVRTVQYSLPLFIAVIAVAIIENRNNAATWSVFGQLINSTKWPSILRTDSASKRRVSKRIIYLSVVATLGTILLAVVSAVSPLGLQGDTYATDPKNQQFSYVRDTSAIGRATPPHADYQANRVCGLE